MGCLSSLEAPLCAVISVVFLVRGLYSTTLRVVESKNLMDDNVLDSKEIMMTSLAIMSLIGICSSRRAFGVFTLAFMLHAFIFSMFNVFQTVVFSIRASENPCGLLNEAPPTSDKFPDQICHAVNGVTLVCTVISMIATGLAAMSVFVRLTTVVLTINDMRSMATSRNFGNSVPVLIAQRSIESEKEEDVPNSLVDEKPAVRKFGHADIFV